MGLSSSLAGLRTSLPVVVFAGLGWFTPRLAGRFGTRRLLAVALMVMSAGLALRALAGSPLLFLALSVPALTGGAVGNVLLPVIVKRDSRAGGADDRELYHRVSNWHDVGCCLDCTAVRSRRRAPVAARPGCVGRRSRSGRQRLAGPAWRGAGRFSLAQY